MIEHYEPARYVLEAVERPLIQPYSAMIDNEGLLKTALMGLCDRKLSYASVKPQVVPVVPPAAIKNLPLFTADQLEAFRQSLPMSSRQEQRGVPVSSIFVREAEDPRRCYFGLEFDRSQRYLDIEYRAAISAMEVFGISRSQYQSKRVHRIGLARIDLPRGVIVDDVKQLCAEFVPRPVKLGVVALRQRLFEY